MNPVIVQMAKNIIKMHDLWLEDRMDPPSLRQGHTYPGDEAYRLAQAVIADHDSER